MRDSKKLRSLDKYLGSFLCFIFSIISLFIRKKKNHDRKKILFIELFEMGASIMTYPSLQYTKKHADNSQIMCLCTKKVRESWELLEIIPKENIFSINDKNLTTFIKSFLKNIIILRKEKIDLVIDLELFMRIPSIISFLIGAKEKAGFFKYEMEGLYRGNFYDYKCAFNQNYHIAKNFLALTKTAVLRERNYPNYKNEIKSNEITPASYRSDKNIRDRMIGKIKRLYPQYNEGNRIILVVPDVGKVLSMRNYPKDYLVKAVARLLDTYPKHLVLLIGVRENMDICSYIHKNVSNERCINFCGQTATIRELVELMNFSELLIGMDNGPIHFASLTPSKILALFSMDTPFVYGPLGNAAILYSSFHCSPCISAFNHKNSRCRNNLCLKTISPDTVYEYAVNMLNDKLRYKTINNELSYI